MTKSFVYTLLFLTALTSAANMRAQMIFKNSIGCDIVGGFAIHKSTSFGIESIELKDMKNQEVRNITVHSGNNEFDYWHIYMIVVDPELIVPHDPSQLYVVDSKRCTMDSGKDDTVTLEAIRVAPGKYRLVITMATGKCEQDFSVKIKAQYI